MDQSNGEGHERPRPRVTLRAARRTGRSSVGRVLPRARYDADVGLGSLIVTTFGVCGRSFFPLLAITLLMTPLVLLGVYLQIPATEHPELSPLTQRACGSLATLYLAFCFVLTQALVSGGAFRALQQRPFGLRESLDQGIGRGATVLSTALLSAAILWLWSLLCGFGILFGIRNAFVAMPLFVMRAEGTERPRNVSARLMAPHLGKIVLLTLLFLVLYFVGMMVGMTGVALFTTLFEDPEDTTYEVMVAAVVPISFWLAGLITVWSVMSCVFLQRLAGVGETDSAEHVAEVF